MALANQPRPLPRWFWFASLLGCTPGFKKTRCKKLLKRTMSRIKLLRGRREVQVRQLRRDVAQLLQLGQEENAGSRLDRLWKEHSLLSAYIKIGEYCQLVKINLRNIAGQRQCPMDLKESLASLCFAASCCADLPELQEIRDIMITKYGKDFLTSAHELLPGEHVNRLFLDAFSTREPLEVSKKALLKGIVAEYNIVQPKRHKVPCIDGGLKKTAPSDCNISNKQQSTLESCAVPESCQPHNVLEPEETHDKSPKQTNDKSPKQTRDVTITHASLSILEGDSDVQIVGRHKGSHCQVSTVQEQQDETDLTSQDGVLRGVSHDKHGKEKARSKRKPSKRTARVNQVGQEDVHAGIDRMTFYDKSGPDEVVSELVHGFHEYENIDNQKSSLDKELIDLVNQQQLTKEHFRSHGKHKGRKRENKPCDGDHLAETKEVSTEQTWNHGFREQALMEDFNNNPKLQEENLIHKKHDHVDSKIYGRFNEKPRPERSRKAFEDVHGEEEHTDFNFAEKKNKQYSRSKRGEKLFIQSDDMQQGRSPRWRNYHMEEGTRGDVYPGFGKTLRPGKMAHENDEWGQSPCTGYKIVAEEWETSRIDSNHGVPHSRHKSRSNGKSRPDTANHDINSHYQERSPVRRNHHGERQTPDKNSRSRKEARKMEDHHFSPNGNQYCQDYVDTQEMQQEKINSLKNPGNVNVSWGDYPNPHILPQRGRKQHIKRRQIFEEARQESAADYTKEVAPERGTNHFPISHIQAQEYQSVSKYPASPIWDHEPDLEPSNTLHHRHVSHKRSTKKRTKDPTNLTTDGNAELLSDREAEASVNGPMCQLIGQSNNGGQFEDGSDYTAERARAHHLPQWHNQFDPSPNGSNAAGGTAVPQHAHKSKGTQKVHNNPEILDEQEALEARLSSYERGKGNPKPSGLSKPPQRPPPPVPSYRANSLPNQKPLSSPPPLTQRCSTLESVRVRANQEPHVHPKLPEYEDLVANLTALRNKPKPPTG